MSTAGKTTAPPAPRPTPVPTTAPAARMDMSQPGSTDFRVPVPETFRGDRNKLKAFLIKCELYYLFNKNKFPDDITRIMWTTTLLAGPAFDWMEAHVTDFMQYRTANGQLDQIRMANETLAIFGSWEEFKKRIGRVFGDIDQERTAERNIQNLRQTGSAATYTAEFQQYCGKTDWEDAALKAQYYRGLKDFVKDEIARSDRPDSLDDMIELAIKIDNRNYERNLEKKGQYIPRNHQKTRGSQWHQPMEIDATQKGNSRNNKPRSTQKERQFKERLCFNCDKPGHIARNCKQPKKQRSKQDQQINATQKGDGELNATFQEDFNWKVLKKDFESAKELALDFEHTEDEQEHQKPLVNITNKKFGGQSEKQRELQKKSKN